MVTVTVPTGERSKTKIEERKIEWNGVAVPFFFPQDAQSLVSKKPALALLSVLLNWNGTLHPFLDYASWNQL